MRHPDAVAAERRRTLAELGIVRIAGAALDRCVCGRMKDIRARQCRRRCLGRLLRPTIFIAWAFVVWTELAAVPPGRRDLLVLQPTQRFEYATFEECVRARDFLLPFLQPTERATGCEEVQ